jgi:protein-tyrosine phosphatase
MVVDLYAPYFAQAVTALTRTRDAAVFHCQLGKDRTGILSALILQSLGVSDEDIVADYMLTEAREPLVRALIEATREGPPPAEEGARFVREPVQAAAMEAVLRKVSRMDGGARGYFTANGAESGALDAWLESLLEDVE